MALDRVDLTLYLVTDTGLCGRDGVVPTVTAAVTGGVSVVQLRDPAASDDEFVALGRELVAALRGTGVPLIVDDRVHLVPAIGAHGAHVGQRDLPPAEARALLGPDAVLGLSVQLPEHLDAVAALEPGTVDYLGIGPLWPQSTKPDAAAPIGVAGFTALREAAALPCVAIGGVTAARTPAVAATGAAGVAVVSAICGSADPREEAARLRRAWHEARP